MGWGNSPGVGRFGEWAITSFVAGRRLSALKNSTGPSGALVLPPTAAEADSMMTRSMSCFALSVSSRDAKSESGWWNR